MTYSVFHNLMGDYEFSIGGKAAFLIERADAATKFGNLSNADIIRIYQRGHTDGRLEGWQDARIRVERALSSG